MTFGRILQDHPSKQHTIYSSYTPLLSAAQLVFLQKIRFFGLAINLTVCAGIIKRFEAKIIGAA
jgi:hypothetical protein